jgi:hypothetical protein
MTTPTPEVAERSTEGLMENSDLIAAIVTFIHNQRSDHPETQIVLNDVMKALRSDEEVIHAARYLQNNEVIVFQNGTFDVNKD